MGSTLEGDGVNLAFKTLPEIRSELRAESEPQARRRRARGAELRGSTYLLNSLACYFLSLSKAERARIVDAGREDFNRRMELDANPEAEPESKPAPANGNGQPAKPARGRKR